MNINNLKESPLVSAAEAARWPTRWWLAYLISLPVLLFVVGGVAAMVSSLVVPHGDRGIAGQFTEAFNSAVMFLALFLWVRFKEKRPVRSLGYPSGEALKRFLIGILIGAGMLTASVLSLEVLGQYQLIAPGPRAISGAAAILPFLLLAVHWIIQASMEETVSRGYQLQVGGLQLPGWLALLIPGLIFSGIHFVDTGFSEPFAMINILLFALFASFIALRQGSLWMVCGIHIGWNWFQGNAFGVPVSGAAPWDVALFHYGPTATSQHWLSGGSFGPEGSFIVTAIWLLALIASYLYFRSGSQSIQYAVTEG